MGNAFLYGNGGGSLNFKVIGGTTQPTGSENLIWVNTSDQITDWVFSRDEPTGVEGRVWFAVSTSSSEAFNAIKRNELWVYPAFCQQYVGGAWVNKTAMTYQSGVWVNWDIYVFNNGYTGGMTWGFSFSGSGSSAVEEQIVININAFNNGIYRAFAWTQTSIDLSRFSKIQFDVERRYGCSYTAYPHTVGVTTTANGNYVAQASTLAAGRSIMEVDISALPNSYYYLTMQFSGAVANTGNQIKVYSIRLVP